MLTIDHIAFLTDRTASPEGAEVPVVILPYASEGDFIDVNGQIGVFDTAEGAVMSNEGDIIALVYIAPVARPADRTDKRTGLEIFRTGGAAEVAIIQAGSDITAIICQVAGQRIYHNGTAVAVAGW